MARKPNRLTFKVTARENHLLATTQAELVDRVGPDIAGRAFCTIKRTGTTEVLAGDVLVEAIVIARWGDS